MQLDSNSSPVISADWRERVVWTHSWGGPFRNLLSALYELICLFTYNNNNNSRRCIVQVSEIYHAHARSQLPLIKYATHVGAWTKLETTAHPKLTHWARNFDDTDVESVCCEKLVQINSSKAAIRTLRSLKVNKADFNSCLKKKYIFYF